MTLHPDLARDPFALTTEEMQRIWAGIGASSLLGADGQPVNATLVSNNQDEPVAIHLRNFFTTNTAKWDDVSSCGETDYKSLHRLFPTESFKVFPKNVRDLIDIVVQSALDDPSVLPDLVTYPYNERTKPDKDSHVDREAQSSRALSGLNIHLTSLGKAEVTLGRIRSLWDLEKRREARANTKDTSERWRTFGAPFVSLTIEAGDVLIFRGGPMVDRGLLPTAHDFVTLGAEGSRLHDVFIPTAVQAEKILPERQRLQDLYDLAA